MSPKDVAWREVARFQSRIRNVSASAGVGDEAKLAAILRDVPDEAALRRTAATARRRER